MATHATAFMEKVKSSLVTEVNEAKPKPWLDLDLIPLPRLTLTLKTAKGTAKRATLSGAAGGGGGTERPRSMHA